MHVNAHDQGFVAVPPERVYEAVAEPDGYERWWPGALEQGPDGARRLRLGGRRAELSVERVREGVGLFLRLGPPLGGTLEWYLEPFEDGTIVSCIVDLDLDGGPRRSARRLHRIRTDVRRGLVGLKGALE